MGKKPFSFLSPCWKIGEGRRVAGGARAAALGLGGGHGEGEKGDKTTGNPFPTLIWAGAQRGGRSTAACGNG